MKNETQSALPGPAVTSPVAPTTRRIMQANRSRDTKLELEVRRRLHAAGLRFRVHVAELPGSPDLVMPKHSLAVFVHGCFWHGHEACGKWSPPATRTDFWATKIERNRRRDARVARRLRRAGWRVLVVRECAIEPGLRRVVAACGERQSRDRG